MAVNLAAPPELLQVNPGDTIRVTSEFDYTGPAVSGTLYAALYRPGTIDPHDEIANGKTTFSIADSPTGKHMSGIVDITVPKGFGGANFGLYSKLIGIPGADIYSPYYDNVIEIVGGISKFTNLEIVSYAKK